MRAFESIGKEDIRDLLGKGWLTHDGMWFQQTAKELGIEKANALNRAAIKAMAAIETERLVAILGAGCPVNSLDQVKEFLLNAMEITLPDSVFSKFRLTASSANILRWEWEGRECFAYKGMKRMGFIDGYACGVIYRIECWLQALGIEFNSQPVMGTCMMHEKGLCRGDFEFFFSPGSR